MRLASAYASIAAVTLLTACAARQAIHTTSTGLRYRVLVEGSGPAAQRGQKVRIHETTTLPNGTLIYDSREKGTPIMFTLGANQVIDGVDQGVTGMRVGERRLLIVPPSLSRRTSYPANTPADSTLHIDLQLLEIRPQ